MLTGRVDGITGELRLDEDTDEYTYLGLGVQRARLRDYGFFVADTWRWKPNLTLNLGLRYELQQPFNALNNSYSKASIADVCGVSGIAPNGACNLFQSGRADRQRDRAVPPVERGGGRDQDRQGQLRAEPRLCLDDSAAQVGCLGDDPRLAGRRQRAARGLHAGLQPPGHVRLHRDDRRQPGDLADGDPEPHVNNLLGTPGTIFLRNPDQLGPPPFSDRRGTIR